jgi:hypothetical protein
MVRIRRREQRDFGYELFIAAVSILSVFNMVLTYIPVDDPDAVHVVILINTVITLIFIFDFSTGLPLRRPDHRASSAVMGHLPGVSHLPFVPDI